MKLPPLVLALLASAALVACTGLFHSTARPDQVYYLRATPLAKEQGVPDPLPSAPSLAEGSILDYPCGLP